MHCEGSLHSQGSDNVDSCGDASSLSEPLYRSPEQAEMEQHMLSALSRKECKFSAGGHQEEAKPLQMVSGHQLGAWSCFSKHFTKLTILWTAQHMCPGWPGVA